MPEKSAQEKTEEASEKKLKDVREKGQYAKSTELNSLTLLAGGTMTLVLIKNYMANELNTYSKNIFSGVDLKNFSTQFVINFLKETIGQYLLLIGPLLFVLFLSTILVNIAQSGFNISMKAAAPKFEKFNILSNVKKLFFSSRSLIETGKSLIKLALISYITYDIVFDLVVKSSFLPGSSIINITEFFSEACSSLIWKLLLCFAIIALVDFVYEKQKYKKEIMMTKQEVKEESKDNEGNPQVKSALRKMQLTYTRKRMMAEVPKADVVITNPTHYAIALKYNMQKNSAPKVVAKGVDEVAQRIKQIALQHNIPLHEDRELARSLYKYCDPGDNIPENLFKAIAKILAYVYKLKQSKKKSIV